MTINTFDELVETVTYDSAEPGDRIEFLGRTLEFVALEEHIEERRWANINLAVFYDADDAGGIYVGLLFDTPATEMQEDQGWFEYSKPELIPVNARLVEQWRPSSWT